MKRKFSSKFIFIPVFCLFLHSVDAAVTTSGAYSSAGTGGEALVARLTSYSTQMLAQGEFTCPELALHIGEPKNLTCYSCFTTQQHGECVLNATTADVITCAPEEVYCRVFLKQTQGAFVSLSRGCARTCRVGCGTWGDDIDKDECYSCCKTDLCNTGNTGVQTRLSRHILLIMFVLCLLQFLCK